MNVEVLLLAMACGLTLLAYMIAINAHGPTRLIISYLIATIMLAGTVWGIVKYVNSDLDAKKIQEFKKLEMEKLQAEQKVQSQEDALRANKERMIISTKLNTFVSTGTGYASTIINVDLQSKNMDLETLMSNAADLKKKTDAMKTEIDTLIVSDTSFTPTISILKQAVQLLSEAAYYYKYFYYAEDTNQEQQREHLLRLKAKAAYEKFQTVSKVLTSSEN